MQATALFTELCTAINVTDGAISVDQLLIAQGGQAEALFNYLVGAEIADDRHKELSHTHRRDRVGLSVETNKQTGS